MTVTDAPTPPNSRNPPSVDAPWDDTLLLSAPSELLQTTSMRRTARAFAEHHGVARPGDVELAVGEALANVVVHAYHGRAPGPLHLTGSIDAELVYLAVADQGSGLEPRVKSPGLGLGLTIIARVSDHVEISHRLPTGTLVAMAFARSTGPDRSIEHTETERLQQIRDQLATAIADGADLDGVQARIDQAGVDADGRDALWLYAWSEVQLAQRRHHTPNVSSS